jgi:Ser/Thr protein kinase RdoA (MazF antagonist)
VAFPIQSLRHAKIAQALRAQPKASPRTSTGSGTKSARLVIHGDFAAHNILVAYNGRPAPAGMIDFAVAYLEAHTPTSRLVCGAAVAATQPQSAWTRSGPRVMTGYARGHPLPVATAVAINVYIRARGIQQAVKSSPPRRPAPPLLAERIDWLSAHQAQLRDNVEEAIERVHSE